MRNPPPRLAVGPLLRLECIRVQPWSKPFRGLKKILDCMVEVPSLLGLSYQAATYRREPSWGSSTGNFNHDASLARSSAPNTCKLLYSTCLTGEPRLGTSTPDIPQALTHWQTFWNPGPPRTLTIQGAIERSALPKTQRCHNSAILNVRKALRIFCRPHA